MQIMTGLIEDDAGMISETDDLENAPKRKKRSRERGKDVRPRNFPLHTMKNLPQFRNKSHEEVRQYILERKGVDIGGNMNQDKIVLGFLVGLTVVFGIIGIWKTYEKYQMRKKGDIRVLDAVPPY